MSAEQKLARLTAGSTMDTAPTGGIPELTRSDIAAALGFAESKVPGDKLGIHVLLARCTADPQSIKALEERLPKMIWDMWYELEVAAPIKRTTVEKMTRIAIIDYCEPGKTRLVGNAQIAKQMGLDYRTWRKHYSHAYSFLHGKMKELETPFTVRLLAALKTQESSA